MASHESSVKPRHSHVCRVLIFDLCPLFRQALASLLEAMPAFKVVAHVGSYDEALAATQKHAVDLVVADLDAGQEALLLLSEVKSRAKACRCVMTLTDGQGAELLDAIRMQADGFLSKRLTSQEFAKQFLQIRTGQIVISDALTNALAMSLRTGSLDEDVRDIHRLSSREREVLRCIAAGMSNLAISQKLMISDGTVKVHVKHILKKLNFTTRVEAALWASKRDLRAR